MRFFKNVAEDIRAANRFSETNKVVIFFFNRGFHALLFYRIANGFHKINIPLLPLIFTRIIQVIYAIDIDYRATIHGGVVIVHGVGLVIGSGALIKKNCMFFHGVTLGRRGIGPVISVNDGFPVVEENCILCTGAVILGRITIGLNSIIGANCVIMNDIPADSICKMAADSFVTYAKLIK